MTPKNHLILSICSGGFFILLDQLLKHFARTSPGATWYVIKPWLGWEFFENPGIAFSLPFPNWLIVIATPLIILGLIIFWLQKKTSPGVFFGLSLVISGAISNYIDRVLFGVTIDYLRLLTSVINLADISIFLGALFILFAEWKTSKNKTPSK